MSYLFLLPLFTAALAAYFWQKSSDEIAYLASAATVISLVLSLVLAPWQIQLLILLAMAIGHISDLTQQCFFHQYQQSVFHY